MNNQAMNQNHILTGGKLVCEDHVIQDGFIVIDSGRIAMIGTKEDIPAKYSEYQVMKIQSDNLILPGFIDVHIHGVAGADVMDGTTEALATMTKSLPQEGTTSFLATTITQSEEAIAEAVSNVAAFMKEDYTGAEILGIHLEGPFINPIQAGAQPRDNVLNPSIRLFDKWQTLAEGNIRLVTFAPEENNGYEFVNYLSGSGVIPSIGHSNATYKEVRKAIQMGLTHATHLYNAMSPLHHREPGVVGAVLLHDEIMAEIIFDGIHVREEMVQLAYNSKGSRKIQLITDSIRAKCLRNGKYDLGGQEVTLKDGEARLANGTLAGSALKMNDAVRRAQRLEHCGLHDLVCISSKNAAKELGVDDRKGTLAIGKDADIVVLDSECNVQKTFCRGKLIYSV